MDVGFVWVVVRVAVSAETGCGVELNGIWCFGGVSVTLSNSVGPSPRCGGVGSPPLAAAAVGCTMGVGSFGGAGANIQAGPLLRESVVLTGPNGCRVGLMGPNGCCMLLDNPLADEVDLPAACCDADACVTLSDATVVVVMMLGADDFCSGFRCSDFRNASTADSKMLFLNLSVAPRVAGEMYPSGIGGPDAGHLKNSCESRLIDMGCSGSC